jgi:ABC-type branched-subunit amino acid transport system substrate-binding protein
VTTSAFRVIPRLPAVRRDVCCTLSYDAAMLIGRATLAVGPDRKLVRDWVSSVGTSGPPMHGVTGDIRFDDHGDPVGKSVVIGRIAP